MQPQYVVVVICAQKVKVTCKPNYNVTRSVLQIKYNQYCCVGNVSILTRENTNRQTDGNKHFHEHNKCIFANTRQIYLFSHRINFHAWEPIQFPSTYFTRLNGCKPWEFIGCSWHPHVRVAGRSSCGHRGKHYRTVTMLQSIDPLHIATLNYPTVAAANQAL